MKEILTLIHYDSLAVRYWFKSRTLSKLFVALAFFGIFFGTSIILFFFTKSFFQPLKAYQDYGVLTAVYLVHAAIIILSWFAFVSATVSISAVLNSSNRQVAYLLTLPIKSYFLTIWLFLKSSIANIFLLGIIFFPVIFAFSLVFFGTFSFVMFLKFLYILLIVILLINSLAGIVSYFVGHLGRDKVYFASIITLTLLFLVMTVLLKIIFPSQLENLYSAQSNEFFSIYNNLPLSNKLIPSYWLVQTLVYGFNVSSLYPLVFTLVVMAISLLFQNKKLTELLRFSYSQPYKKINIKKDFINNNFLRYPLFLKDLYSIFRVPSEIGYSFFLISIVFFFFLFLSILIFSFKISESIWNKEMIVFSSAWLMFFATAFLMRLIYPLMAREGPNSWYIFSLPLKLIKILKSKILFGLIGSLPFILLSILLWLILPTPGIDKLTLILFSSLAIVILSLINTLLGFVDPNFEEGDDPEKLSTSAMGIVTLFISMAFVTFSNYIFYTYLKQNISFINVFFLLVLIGVTLIGMLFFLAVKSSKNYQF